MEHAALVAAIDQLPCAEWNAAAWRHVAVGRAPLSGEGARITGGRWNPPGSFAVLYLGADPSTVVAEFHRLARRQGVDPTSFLPRTFFRYDVALHRLLDVRDNRSQAELGLNQAALVSDDLTRCQAVGEAAFAAGREGVLAPSAAGSGDVIAVFLERLDPRSFVRDVESELWEYVPPQPE